jgi:hypothetical protein
LARLLRLSGLLDRLPWQRLAWRIIADQGLGRILLAADGDIAPIDAA